MNVRRTVLSLVLVAAVFVSDSGCGVFGSYDSNLLEEGGLEKSTIKVSIQQITDLGPFWLAQEDGYFRAEGLDVKSVMADSGQASIGNVISGRADIAFSSYASFFVAKSVGADLWLVADGTSVSPRSNAIVAAPNSPVRTVNDLAGKKIAITAKNTASDILAKSVMRDRRVSYGAVNWVEMPFLNVAAALQQGQIDAAYVAEPYVTIAARVAGAIPVVDINTGSTQDFPLAGFGSMKTWAQENPKTLAAFQRAMKKATLEVVNDRSKVEPLLAKYAKIDEGASKLLTLPGFGSTLDAHRLQRVPDLMMLMGVITSPVDAMSMIAPQLTRAEG